jgi:hypothetical protein
MAFAPVDAVPYVLAIASAVVGYVYPEFIALFLLLVALAAYTFFADKPRTEQELLLAAFFTGAAAHWCAGRAFTAGGLAQLSFPPYALWGLALGLSAVWAKESGERSGYAFALGAFVLPLALGPSVFGGRIDALLLAGVFLAAGAAIAVRFNPCDETRGLLVARASLAAALASSVASGLAFLVRTGAAFTLPSVVELGWLYLNLVWYALVPSAVAITGLSLLHHAFFSRGREARHAAVTPALIEEG